MSRRIVLLILCFLTFCLTVPAVAQDSGIILQLSAPFFAEDILMPVIEEYEAANPGIQVNLVFYQGFGLPVQSTDDAEADQDELAAYFSLADVLLVDNGLTPEATRAGYVLDLSPLTSSDPNFNASAFHPALLDSFEWDNGQWALPASTSFIAVSYIPAAFDEAGLNYPSESWTLADLESAAQTLTQYNADGTVTLPGMIVQGANNALPALFLSLLGSGVYIESSIPSSPDFSNPALESLLTDWLAFDQTGLLDLPEDVNANQAPLVIGNPQFIGGGGGFGGNQQNQVERATALLPGGSAGLSVGGYAISRGTLYPEQAYDLINFLVNHPNAVTATFGSVPAVIGLDTAQGGNQGGGPGFGPFGGGVPAALQPLVDSALQNGIPASEARFASGLVSALTMMQDEALDAQTALSEAQANLTARLAVADTRAATPITVNAPELPPMLAAGEIALNFAILGGGPGGLVQQQWEDAADQFVSNDAEVGLVNVDTENPNDLATVATNYDCFYAGTNLVPDADLTQLLSLDPLVSVDSSFDSSDFVAGVLDQVKANNQLYALPLQISPLVLRFNADLLNQAGVTVPQAGWTASDLEDAVRQLVAVTAEDETPLELNASGQTAVLMLIAVYGGIPFDTRTSPPTINFTDPATVAAIQQVLNLAHDGYLSYTVQGGGGGGGQNNDDIPLYSNVINAFSFGGFGGGGGQGGGTQNTDGIVTFPAGSQYNVAAFNLGTGYISAVTQYPDACYRFLSYLSQSTEIFDSMPARYSQLNNADLALAQGNETVAFYQNLANTIQQPNTLRFPNNINAGNFGMTTWLFGVFERYLADEVVDLEADLADAQTSTQVFMDCVNAIPPIDPNVEGAGQSFFEQVQACQTAANGGVSS